MCYTCVLLYNCKITQITLIRLICNRHAALQKLQLNEICRISGAESKVDNSIEMIMMSSGGVVLMLLDHVEKILHRTWPNFSIRGPECP